MVRFDYMLLVLVRLFSRYLFSLILVRGTDYQPSRNEHFKLIIGGKSGNNYIFKRRNQRELKIIEVRVGYNLNFKECVVLHGVRNCAGVQKMINIKSPCQKNQERLDL